MTRTWMLCASPFAFAAGMMLVHCSSSSSTGTTPPNDAGKMDTGAKKDAGTGKGTGTGTGKGTGTGTGKGTGTGTGSGAGFDAGMHSITCGGAACETPANVCCDTKDSQGNAVYTCQAASAQCGGSAISCFGTTDCSSGAICCLNAESPSAAILSCQAGTVCPTEQLASAQICATDADCANDSCIVYNCLGSIIEACKGTIAGGLGQACNATDAGVPTGVADAGATDAAATKDAGPG
jgi:hypothetical protein